MTAGVVRGVVGRIARTVEVGVRVIHAGVDDRDGDTGPVGAELLPDLRRADERDAGLVRAHDRGHGFHEEHVGARRHGGCGLRCQDRRESVDQARVAEDHLRSHGLGVADHVRLRAEDVRRSGSLRGGHHAALLQHGGSLQLDEVPAGTIHPSDGGPEAVGKLEALRPRNRPAGTTGVGPGDRRDRKGDEDDE